MTKPVPELCTVSGKPGTRNPCDARNLRSHSRPSRKNRELSKLLFSNTFPSSRHSHYYVVWGRRSWERPPELAEGPCRYTVTWVTTQPGVSAALEPFLAFRFAGGQGHPRRGW